MREITQEVCPKSTYQETHWLVPRAAGQLANGEQRRMMKCMIAASLSRSFVTALRNPGE